MTGRTNITQAAGSPSENGMRPRGVMPYGLITSEFVAVDNVQE